MQLVARRRDGKDGLILRLASHERTPAELGKLIIDAVYAASPPYSNAASRGFIHPLSVEWVRPSELVTNPRTGKLIEVVDERPSS